MYFVLTDLAGVQPELASELSLGPGAFGRLQGDLELELTAERLAFGHDTELHMLPMMMHVSFRMWFRFWGRLREILQGEDDNTRQRGALLPQIETHFAQETHSKRLFTIPWMVE